MKKLLLCICLAMPGIVWGQSAQQADELFNNGQYQEALSIYELLVKKSPKNSLYTYRYARCKQETGHHSEAIDYFHRSGDRFVLCYYFMGESYLALGMPDEAITSYQTYLDKSTSEDRIARIQKQISYAEKLKRYIKRVQHITITDTIRLHKQALLSAYSLSQEAGSLSMDTTTGRTSYMNQRKDRQIYSSQTDEGTLLMSRYRLMDTWSQSEVLSPTINFTQKQNFPFIMSDGMTMYFAAEDSNGMGGLDIYMTQYNSNNNTYMKVENIGFPFNSKGNDYLYAIDEFTGYGYFASDRFCHEDSVTVYRFRYDETPRYWTNISADSAMAYATMTLRDVESTPMETTPSPETATVKKAERPFRFVVNDRICYTSLSEFRSQDAMNVFVQYLEDEQQLEILNQTIDGLRQQYLTAGTSEQKKIATQLTEKEMERDALKASAAGLLRQAWMMEQKALPEE